MRGKAEQRSSERFFFGVALARAVGLQQFCGGEWCVCIRAAGFKQAHRESDDGGRCVWLFVCKRGRRKAVHKHEYNTAERRSINSSRINGTREW